VAAVETPRGPVQRDRDIRDAAGAEEDLHAAALVDGAVEEDPEVGAEPVAILLEDFREMG
jgi:hypothetical protein